MKTKFLKIGVIALIVFGSFSSCKEKTKDDAKKIYSAKEGKIDISETEFVRMYFSPESGYIGSPIKLITENNTKGVLSYGTPFSLEYLNNNIWEDIQLDINFEDIGLRLLSGGTKEGLFNMSLIDEYNNGKKGKYRYVKTFGLSYDILLGETSPFTLYAEFEIK